VRPAGAIAKTGTYPNRYVRRCSDHCSKATEHRVIASVDDTNWVAFFYHDAEAFGIGGC